MFRTVAMALVLPFAFAPESERPSPDATCAAVARALPLLVQAAEGHTAQRTCFACHNQGLPILALTAARGRGFPERAEFFRKQGDHIAAFLDENREKYRQGLGQGGQADTAGYALLALELCGRPADATTEAVTEYLLLRDPKSDHWRTSSNRPPSEVSDFSPTYLAIRALRHWGTPAQRDRIDRRVAAARHWLLKTPGKDTEDKVFRLFALRAVDANDFVVRRAAREVLKSQLADGGWMQTAGMDPDAYATGSALVALHEAGGLPTTDPAYQRGMAFLLRNQQPDGSWRIGSRSKPFQTYFESGFPYGPDQFISAAATGWATTALALAVPPR